MANVQNAKNNLDKEARKMKRKMGTCGTKVGLKPPKLEMLVKTQYVVILYNH